eukprot:COSAG02_NODE_2285_length_9220_cov_87.964368_5_plen_193_part_00
MTTDLTATTCKVLGLMYGVYQKFCLNEKRECPSTQPVHSISTSVQLLSRLIYIDVGETDCEDLIVVLDEVASKAVLLSSPVIPSRQQGKSHQLFVAKGHVVYGRIDIGVLHPRTSESASSSQSFRFVCGKMICSTAERRAAMTFSFTPPIFNTLPVKLNSPVMATLLATGSSMANESNAVAIVIPTSQHTSQ